MNLYDHIEVSVQANRSGITKDWDTYLHPMVKKFLQRTDSDHVISATASDLPVDLTEATVGSGGGGAVLVVSGQGGGGGGMVLGMASEVGIVAQDEVDQILGVDNAVINGDENVDKSAGDNLQDGVGGTDGAANEAGQTTQE